MKTNYEKQATDFLKETGCKMTITFKENCKNQNVGIINALDALIMIRAYSLEEIRGSFSPGEWSFLADSLNGTMTTDSFRCNGGALAYHCLEADRLDTLGEKWEIDVLDLMDKIQDLTAAQVDAVYFRVEQFWEDENRNLEEFARF